MCGIYEVLEVVKVGATGVIHRGRAKRSDWIRSAPDQLKVNSTLETHPQAAVPALGSKQESAHVNLFLKLEALEAPRQQMVNEWRVYESLSRTVGLPSLPPGVGGFPTARFDLDRGNGDDNARGGDGQDGTEVTLGTASSSSGRSSSTKGSHLSGGISSAGSSAQRVLAMEALGPDLGALLSSTRGGRLGLKSVLALGEQMVDLLRTFHAAGWAHRDIKPENFCVGAATGGNGNGNGNDLDASAQLFLIDFGVATPLRSPSSLASAESAVQKTTPAAAIGKGGGGGGLAGNENNNNNTSDGVSNRCDQDRGGGAGAAMVGSLRYLSARAHERSPLVGALDDLESVAYVLLWLFKGGSLPWQGLPTGAGTGRGAANPSSSSQQKQQQQQGDPKRVKRAAVGLLKQQLTPEALCGTDCPCLAEYLTLVRSMMKAEEERYAAEVVRRRRVGGGGGGGGGAAAWAVAAQTSSEVGEGGRLLGEATREEASAVVDYGKLRRVFGRWRTRRGILDDGRFEWNRQSIHQEPTPQLRPQPTTITAAAAAAEVEALTHGVVPLVSLYGELPPPAPSAGHGDTASSTATSSDNNDDDDDDDDDGGDGGGDRSTTKRNSQVCALSERSTSGNKSNEVDSSEEVTLPNVSVSSSSLSSSSLLSSSLHSSAVSSSSSSPALSSPPTATGTGERVSPAVSTAAMVEQQATQGTKEVGDGMTATETTARRKRRCPPFEPPPSDLRPGCSVLKQPGAAAADGSGGGGGAGEAGVERENEKRSLDGDSREANSSSRSSGSGGGSSKRARIVHWFSHGSSSSSSSNNSSSSSSSSSHGVAPAAATGEAAVVARSDEAVERAKGDDEKGGNEMDDDDEKGAPCVEREGGGCPVSEEWVLKGLGPANLWEAFVANSEQQHGGTGSGGSGGGTDDEKLLARWRAQLSSSSGGADKTQAAAAAAAAASGDGGGVSLSFASTLPLPKAEHSIATPSSEAYSSSAAAAAAPPPASGTSAKMNAVAALLKIVPHLRDSSSKKAPKALGLLATLLRAECRASNAPEFHAALAVSLGGDARRIHGPNRQLRNGYASLFGSVASGDVLSLFEASAARPKLALWCVAAFVFNRCLPAPGQSPLPANPTAAAAAAAAAAATTTTTPPPPLVASSTSSDWCAGLSEDNFGEVVGTLSELLDVMLGDDKGGGGGQGQGFVAKKSANTKNGALGSGSDASAAMATLSPVAEDLFKARLVDVLKRLYEGFSRDSWMVPVAPAASATTSGSGSQGLAGASGSSGVAGGLGAPSATGFAQGPSAGELARRAQEVDARRTIMLQTNRSTVLECFDKALRLPAGFWPPPAGRAQRTQLERMRSTMHARR